MLRLPQFEIESPDTVEGVITALQRRPGARIVAGGTDILPNLKHFLDTPPALISLARVSALRGVVRDDAAGVVRIGAGVTLLPSLSVPMENRRGHLAIRPFAAPAPSRTVALVWRQSSPMAKALKELAAVLKKAWP